MSHGAAQAFIAFLRCEAIQSEERAKSLRATAAAIEANNLEGRCFPFIRRRNGIRTDEHKSSRPIPMNNDGVACSLCLLLSLRLCLLFPLTTAAHRLDCFLILVVFFLLSFYKTM